MRLDATIGVSLLDRGEQDRLQGKLDRVQPNIPQALSAGVAKMVHNMQGFAADKPKPGPSTELENLDPNKVIRDNTVKQVIVSKPVEKEAEPAADMRRLNTNSSLSHHSRHGNVI